MFDQDYLERVEQCWHKFVIEGCAPEAIAADMRPMVLRSWIRSREYGVKPDAPSQTPLTQEELNKRLEKNDAVLRVAMPFMKNLYSFLDSSQYLMLFADNEGCLLKYFANNQLFEDVTASYANLRVGAFMNEYVAGTAGVSLCIAEDAPIELIGHDHYMPDNHSFFCVSAPVHDPDNRLVACLTVFAPKELYHQHTLGIVRMTCEGIENTLRMELNYQRAEENKNLLASTFNRLTTGTMILDAEDRVINISDNAVRYLRLASADEILGQNFFDLFLDSSSLSFVHNLKKEIQNSPFTLVNKNNIRLELSLSIQRVISHGEHTHTILSIEEQAQVHKLTSHVNGFHAQYTFDSIIGSSEATLFMKKMGMIAAGSDSNLLILGESGTGKELLAQSVHNASSRAQEPFVAINCASLPRNLIESELFGYENGAFTGASKKGQPGKFELADGGTIFLDEIGDMPLELQTALLRTLQSHEITRLGGKFPRPVNVRVIAATNVNLTEAVRDKRFRSDLYYRLNVLNIHIPSLRHRKDDIMPLVEEFIRIYNRSLFKNVQYVTDDAKQLLMEYDWPGNIRELENAIERAINLTESNALTLAEFPDLVMNQDPNAFSPRLSSSRFTELPRETISHPKTERDRIMEALRAEQGNVANAAKQLNLPLSTLYRKLKKYDLNAKDFKRGW